jgi:DNA-binding transcriptional ArsR family regulator
MDSLRRLKAEIFQALGHPTRLAILETLQRGELTVGAILSRLGLEQGNISQHLAILRGRRLVATRKQGNRVFYSLRDPILGRVLAQMRRYTASHLAGDLALLRELEDGRAPRRAPGRPRTGRVR